MHSEIGDVFGEIPTTVWAIIGLVFEFLLSHQIISVFETVVSGALATSLFAIIIFGTLIVFIVDLLDIAGIRARG